MIATRLLSGVICACSLLIVSCRFGSMSGDRTMPFVVTAGEREHALKLLEKAENFRSLQGAGPMYLIDVEVLLAKGAEGQRELVVTNYRPEGDLAILSRVNLTANKVVSVESVPHLPVRLSQEEFEIARRLALADAALVAKLAGKDVEIEAQLSRTFDKTDPQFGHRVVHLLFRTETGYLEIPSVTVDLTTKEVVIEREGD